MSSKDFPIIRDQVRGLGSQPGDENQESTGSTEEIKRFVLEHYKDSPLLEDVGFKDRLDRAVDSLDGLYHESFAPEANTTDDLEALILPALRPAFDIKDGKFNEHLPPRWSLLDDHRENINQVIQASGRIEVHNHPKVPYGGTGFVVGPNIVMTNRHVAELFARGTGTQHVNFVYGRGCGWNPRMEIEDQSTQYELKVTKVLMIHPYWDMALLQVEGLEQHSITPLTLVGREPDAWRSSMVAVVGYPARDSRNNSKEMDRVFRNSYEVKRLLPGYLKSTDTRNSFGNKNVLCLTHDCSTLGGNSGSAVVDVTSGHVVGLHFSGLYKYNNYAVPTWKIAEDERVREVLSNFTDNVVSPSSIHGGLWAATEVEATSVPGSSMPESGATDSMSEPPSRGLSVSLAGLSDEERALLYIQQPEETERELRRWMGEHADVYLDFLKELISLEDAESFNEGVDPHLSEVILLPGILGSNLERPTGLFRTIWLSAWQMARGNVAEKLTLARDGMTDAYPDMNLEPGSPIGLLYDIPRLGLRLNGIRVHQFSYDWRKSIKSAAERLHNFIETLAAERPNKKFVLVGHSMGGLVAAAYSHMYAGWKSRVEQAIFLGSPLHGSFMAMKAFLGTHNFFNNLTRIMRRDDPMDVRRLALSLPGLIGMLPDPARLSDGNDALYKEGSWEAEMGPAQQWLDESLELKSIFTNAPIYKRSSVFVTAHMPTAGSFVVENGELKEGATGLLGDGTVPALSAAPEAVACAYKTTYSHMMMPTERQSIQAISQLVKGLECELEELERDNLDTPTRLESVVGGEEGIPDELEGIQKRLEKGQLTLDDIEWMWDDNIMKRTEIPE